MVLNVLSRLTGGKVADETALPKPPGPLSSIGTILYRLHTAEPLKVEHEVPQTLLEDVTARLKFSLHVSQRTARILGTLLVRTVVKHPLGMCAAQQVKSTRCTSTVPAVSVQLQGACSRNSAYAHADFSGA